MDLVELLAFLPAVLVLIVAGIAAWRISLTGDRPSTKPTDDDHE